MAAEGAKRVLMSIVEDGTNRYEAVRSRVVGGMLAVGTWYAMVHWDADRGPMGDVVFETLGMDQVFPCPGYLDLHDPACPWVIVERHETPEALVAKGWAAEGELWPDCDGKYGEGEWAKAHGHPSNDDSYEPPTVTVLYYFSRKGGETYQTDGGYRNLTGDSQYMACPSCGAQDRMHQRMPDGQLPEVGMPCPDCLNRAAQGQGEPSYMYRVTREKLTEHRLKYPDGKLCVIAPKQQKLLDEGPWPSPTRSFPIWQQRAYESPYEQEGGCDTLLYWSLQALMDQLRKQMFDQMVTSKPVIVMAEASDGGPALVDANNRPFLYSADNGQIAYARNLPPGMPIQSAISQYQGNGMPGSAPSLYSILAGSFYQSRGTDQLSFAPDQSRDVAFKSLMLQQQSGEVPVDDHKRVMRREEGMFLGCVLDVWVANSNEARAIRYLGQDGQMEFQLLKGSDIPNVDVVVGTPPQIKQGAIDEVQALMTYSQIPLASMRAIAAKKLGLSASEVQQIEADIQKQQALAAQAQMQAQGPPQGQPPPQMAAAFGGASPPAMQ